MDPLSILGASIGVTSLIIQVTDECIKSHKVYRDAVNLPAAYKHLRVRFHLEQQRFLNFTLEAGLLYTEGDLSSTLQINRSLLLATLAEIKILLEQYAIKNGKYHKLETQVSASWDASSEAEPNLLARLCLATSSDGVVPSQKPPENRTADSTKGIHKYREGLRRTGNNLRSIITEPKRLSWATVDREEFEQLISKLDKLNSVLIALLDSSQARKLQETMNDTYIEILQLRNDLSSLKALVGALGPLSGSQHTSLRDNSPFHENITLASDPLARAVAEEQSAQRKRRAYLKELAEIKIKIRHDLFDPPERRDVNLISSRASTDDLLPLKKSDFDKAAMKQETPQVRTDAIYRGTNVWIEWKTSSHAFVSSSKLALVESRIKLLTDLLRAVKPDGFRAPPCLGYVKIKDDDYGARFGIVFEKPSAGSVQPTLTTLRDLLGRSPKPSLGVRVSLCATLARCVQSFHAVTWLHKALRPDNIIYCSNPPNLEAPFVTGFEFSRPSMLDEMTEKPGFDPSKDIYLHPNAQSFQTDGSYRTSYDVYSLGILMIEIVQWMPIGDIVGLQNLSEAKPSTMQNMQAALLGDTVTSDTLRAAKHCLSDMASACGDVVRDVVECCLRADKIEQRQNAKEPEGSIAVRLHSVIEENVVKKLEQIAKVL